MKEIKYVTNRNLLGSLIGSQFLKNIDINVYFDGPLDNPEGIDGFPFTSAFLFVCMQQNHSNNESTNCFLDIQLTRVEAKA